MTPKTVEAVAAVEAEVAKVSLPGAIDLTKIKALMGTGRVRGLYDAKLVEFENSDDPAINVAETWPIEMGQKPATTIYQGFNNVLNKNDLKDKFEVKQSDGQVYLLHKERVALLMASENTNGAS